MKLLIVDDQAIVRLGVAALLARDHPHADVLQAKDVEEGLRIAEAHGDLDAVFLDIALPGGDGLSAIAEFGRRRADLPVIVLSGSDDPATVRRSFDLGALGYVAKSAGAETLLAALKLVLSGEMFVPSLLLREAEPARAACPRLTERQTMVLSSMAEGLTNKQIARRYGLAEKTVKTHVTAILRELGAANRAQAVALSNRSGPA